ncbi:dynein axonemal intermediate chain 7 isoform X2 [Takifugu flavidus]|uniref:dynein axonemal intermediate chain 7 isoform X2 n=1 Tax=Takifugu flavidus TaxID=433684 RepID=UPI002544268E|nr:dynein axonemal intermediate chain 7 isoform X2 [Takifugu flavidus]
MEKKAKSNKPTKKAPKLTKAQKAKQEEEARKQREEEEARLRAEKEEQERLERERKQEEIDRLELKDSKRREGELDELRHLLEANHTAATKWKSDAVKRVMWERYMCCDGRPDPTAQREINTYISLWRDDQEVDITHVLEQCSSALQLIEELEVQLKDAPCSEEYREAIIDLQGLVQSKQLLATEELLKVGEPQCDVTFICKLVLDRHFLLSQNANESIDSETGNMQTVVKDETVTLCLWANFRKNPRFKGFLFEEAGLGFELPKQLAVSNVAVRILHTRYDLLSLLVRMAQTETSTSPRPCSLGADMESSAPDEDSTIEGEEGNEDQKENEDVQNQPTQEPEGKESTDDVGKGSLDSTVMTQMEVLDAGGELTSPLSEMSMKQDLQVVDLMQYTPLGGVFYYNVFYLPPQAHQVNGWKIRQLLDHGLQEFPYPPERSDADGEEQVSNPPVGVTFTLPDSVFFLETPQVARWDDAGKQWRLDEITDVLYEKDENKISIKMASFQPLVLLQETYANFPFQSWELRPLGQDVALFTINGALIDLRIKIQGDQCMLQLEQETTLPQLTNRWLSVSALQTAIINAGINVFVNEHSEKYVSTCAKDPLTEHAAYEQMALFASACAFSWSKWNTSCGSEHLVLQACEHHGADPVPKESWSLYLLGAQRYKKLAITDQSEAFSPEHDPGSEFHSTFIHMLQDSMSAGGVARTRESHYLFVNTVQSLLCGTRPLMYA